MILADTHTHVYLNAFEDDTQQVIERALSAGVKYIFLPNIDVASIEPMFLLAERYPDVCFPMAGLHPGSVNKDHLEQIKAIKKLTERKKIVAVGECGMDLYWDKTYAVQQKEVFNTHIEWAIEMQLPVSIHIRDAFKEVFDVLKNHEQHRLNGVFHCFSGGIEEAKKAIDLGFCLGIGGVVTFKNTRLAQILKEIKPKNIVLESDAPFLSPVPYRGKRNEPAYLTFVAEKLAEIWNMPVEKVAEITTENALNIFKID